MVAKIFSEPVQVANFETDLHGDINLQYLIDTIVQVSEDQSNDLAVGINRVQQAGATWVVIQYDVTIMRLPRANERLEVSTQGSEYTNNFARRNFWARTTDGQLLVSVTSLWVTMDLKTRKMVKINPEMVTPYGSERVHRIGRMQKIQKLPSEEVISTNYPVRFSDIDFNGHVSNTHYIGWMVDTLPFSFLKAHRAVGFSIKFADEVRYGDAVTSRATVLPAETGYDWSVHQILVQEQVSATAQIKWENLE
ncbi:oleoyl-, acyl-carrier protein thioesterase (putative) [Fructilactobacillus florum 8D]|uniref:Oleoyl-, acyl-carrier protein thioesterase (Putative) n=2 Tax=Fructilactobacillus florum TaxID=640331 RepID=W9EDT3_9LACO|nr:acyl-ACP thioesterase domain-containing protein [Fructilactobacillus florum]EKK20031.1 oleoyl-, acyl-carrier protein thioesterase (putative) [Fructilactobacillus florum 2F]ETO40293.1 oleoyl-, acyl-carrier protein thioesterase (putative) [Fructilactobacillus florum 8D]KRM92550.1 hypothetical protein FC87_GL000162 [Fructilactobacillus florum DSM 22689 = JCM 16035]